MIFFSSKKSIFFLCFIFSLITYSFDRVQAKPTETLDHIVAIVNDEVITASQLNHKTQHFTQLLEKANQLLPDTKTFKQQVLNRMIVEQVQLQRAKEYGIEIDDLTVNTALEKMAKQAKLSLADFKKNAKQVGTSFEQLRSNVRKELTIEQLQNREIGQAISISSAEIDHFLNSPLGQEQIGVSYRLSHILLTLPSNPSPEILKQTQDKADSILAALKQGEDFGKLALSYSQGQQAFNRGDLGWRALNSLPTLFMKQVASMKLGETVGPIRSSSGLHLIKLEGKREENTSDEMQTHVRQILIKVGSELSDAEAKAKLEKIHATLLSGKKTFELLAKKHSQELASSQAGGDLGWISKATVLPTFAEKMDALSLEEISQPFKTQLGWHLIQVLDRRTHKNTDLVRNKVHRLLFNRKFEQTLLEWLHRLKEEADIKIYLEYA